LEKNIFFQFFEAGRKIMNDVLEEAIWHWIMISHGIDVEYGAKNCSLCQTFTTSCEYCPVNAVTNDACNDTSFFDWNDHHWECHQSAYGNMGDPYFVMCDQCRILALDEVGFLYSLL
jgi:hypothetical protein